MAVCASRPPSISMSRRPPRSGSRPLPPSRSRTTRAAPPSASASSTRTGCPTWPTSGCATAPWSRWTTRPASSSPTSVSADYYSTKHNKRFQPKYDVVGNGYRQPGSAFKPFNYAIGIDSGKLTAGTVLMDVGTDFGNDYTPNDADRLERGPLTIRNALQFSLNIPSVKALAGQRPGDGLRARPGIRAALPGRLEQCRPVAGARHPGNAAGRPGHRVRHDRQRRSVHREHYDPHGQGPQRRARRRSARAARADTGHQPAGRLHHHEHPGRQYEPQRQPVLGQVRAARP